MSNNGTSTGSNDVDLDASWQTNLIACAAATWAIAAVFVALRFYLRGHILHVLGREDWMILVALFFSAAYSIGYIVDAHFGFGKHAAALSPATLSIVTETYWLGMLWFTTTVLFTKLSILFLYLRTLTHLWVQRTLRVLLAMVLLTSLTDYVLMFTTCIPLKAYWDASIKAAYCHSMQAYYAILGIQLGTDFFTFLLPLPVIWSMRAPKDQKIMLLVLFSFGFFICVVSIIRLTQLATTRFKSDFTYDSAATDFWSLIEANTGIVCACIMTMNPLLRRLVPEALLTRRGFESTQDPLGINGGGGGGGAKSGKSGKGGGNGGTGGKIMRIRDKSGHGGTTFFNNYSINPPTIGSKPSRPNTVVVKKQSWFTAQLARLDRSLQTLNEAESGAGVNGDRRRSARSGSSSYETAHTMEAGLHLPPLPASVFLLPVPDMPRRSHHSSSSISTPIEQEIDEGPLEQQRWARRPSCAPSSPGTTRRPSVAAVPPQPGSPIVSTMRRPSCAPSEPGAMRRPSMAPSSPGG